MSKIKVDTLDTLDSNASNTIAVESNIACAKKIFTEAGDIDVNISDKISKSDTNAQSIAGDLHAPNIDRASNKFIPLNTYCRELDLTLTDEDLKGFYGGFTDGKYVYFVPYHNDDDYHGKIARVDLFDFSTVDVLDLTSTDADLKGFVGGFTDGRYGYFAPYKNDSNSGKVARVDLSDFSTVDVLDLTQTDEDLIGFHGGFADGRYGYFVPNNNNGGASGKVARINLFNGGHF